MSGLRILCIRFSAIGDVAMTVPVVKALATAHPDVHVIMVSRPFARAFYEGLADNVEFVGLDLKQQRYKGVFGAEHVYHDLRELNPDMVADLHDVLRTKYARMRFRMAGIPVAHIDKHRKGRKELTRQQDKMLVQQPTSFEKYQAVFKELGLEFNLKKNVPLDIPLPESFINNRSSESSQQSSFVINHSSLIVSDCVGIAPFAAHEGKIYPVQKMEQVIDDLRAAHPDLNILLFGGGERDEKIFNQWCRKYDNVYYASAQCNGMREELAVMQQLRCLVSMDSGNMHMASLVGTPVVSIWGATHPYAGFMGWGQSTDDAVQVSLPCRPCSIYGNKPCMRDDYACLNMITPSQIVSKIERYL